MSKVNVRYIVSDVDAVIPFYTDMLGFKLDMHPAPRTCREAIYSYCSTDPVPAGPDKPYRVVSSLLRVAGIESRSKSRTWKPLSRNLRLQEGGSATRS